MFDDLDTRAVRRCRELELATLRPIKSSRHTAAPNSIYKRARSRLPRWTPLNSSPLGDPEPRPRGGRRGSAPLGSAIRYGQLDSRPESRPPPHATTRRVRGPRSSQAYRSMTGASRPSECRGKVKVCRHDADNARRSNGLAEIRHGLAENLARHPPLMKASFSAPGADQRTPASDPTSLRRQAPRRARVGLHTCAQSNGRPPLAASPTVPSCRRTSPRTDPSGLEARDALQVRRWRYDGGVR